MFRSYRVDLSGALRLGVNEIAITFRSAEIEAAKRQAAQPYFVPFSANNTPIHNGNMLRKPSCDFGWDWNIALASFGVYGDFYLEPLGAARMAAVVISQQHSANRAVVRVQVAMEGAAEGALLSFALGALRTTATVHQGQATAEITVENPQLWWPAGQGAQVLHDLVIGFGDQMLHAADRFARCGFGQRQGCGGSGLQVPHQWPRCVCQGRELDPAGCAGGADHARKPPAICCNRPSMPT